MMGGFRQGISGLVLVIGLCVALPGWCARVLVDPLALEQAAYAALTQRYAGYVDTLAFENLAPRNTLGVWVESADYRIAARIVERSSVRAVENVTLSVLAVDSGRLLATVPVRVAVQAYRQVPVLARDLAVGSMLAVSDVTQANVNVAGRCEVWQAPVEGYRLTRNARVGDPLCRTLLQPAPWVEAGRAVRIISRMGAVNVVADGYALSNGSANDSVRVRLADDGHGFQARVAGINHVVVEP